MTQTDDWWVMLQDFGCAAVGMAVVAPLLAQVGALLYAAVALCVRFLEQSVEIVPTGELMKRYARNTVC